MIQADAGDANCRPERFAESWLETNFCERTIDLDEIITALPADRIQAVDNPQMESIESAELWLSDRSPVIAFEIKGDARAYPLAILISHEIVNDSAGDVPLVITYCPLCNSSLVFDRRVEGQVLTFGVSGNLRNSDLVMFDRETESWWQQFTGEGIVGDMAGQWLDVIPSQVIGFAHFKELYPDGQVLVRPIESGYYGIISPAYVDYDVPFDHLFEGELDRRLRLTSHVLATEIDGVAIAYPFAILAEEGVINDTVSGTHVVAFWQPGMLATMDQMSIDESRDVGTASLYDRRLEDGRVLTFSYDAETDTIVDNESGSIWSAFGEAVSGELAGTRLRLRIASPYFWFAWVAFHEDTLIYGIE